MAVASAVMAEAAAERAGNENIGEFALAVVGTDALGS